MVQLYLRDELSSVVTPVKVLRGFARVFLRLGQRAQAHFTLACKDFSLLNQTLRSVVEPGRFEVMVGSSSEEIRLKGSFVVTDL